jgi:hypothetical protein
LGMSSLSPGDLLAPGTVTALFFGRAPRRLRGPLVAALYGMARSAPPAVTA